MDLTQDKAYLFIDESEDPIFYGNRKKLLVGTEGFQPYLIIGMIQGEGRYFDVLRDKYETVINLYDEQELL